MHGQTRNLHGHLDALHEHAAEKRKRAAQAVAESYAARERGRPVHEPEAPQEAPSDGSAGTAA